MDNRFWETFVFVFLFELSPFRSCVIAVQDQQIIGWSINQPRISKPVRRKGENCPLPWNYDHYITNTRDKECWSCICFQIIYFHHRLSKFLSFIHPLTSTFVLFTLLTKWTLVTTQLINLRLFFCPETILRPVLKNKKTVSVPEGKHFRESQV